MRRALFAAAFGAMLLAGSVRAGDAPGPLAGARLVQATLAVRELPRAVAFYRDVLGLKLLFEVPGAAFFDAGGVRLRLEQTDTATPATGELYFDDPGLVRAEALTKLGFHFLAPAETVQRGAKADLKLIEFLDPDGNALGLLGEVARP